MPSLSFNKIFVSKVKSGRKRQTIRALRKYPIKKGDTLYLYTALRTKYSTKLREVTCTGIDPVKITRKGITIYRQFHRMRKPIASFFEAGHFLTDAIAVNDGFKDWEDMKAWWIKTNGLPFRGTIIYW